MIKRTRTFYFFRFTGNSVTVFINYKYHYDTQDTNISYWSKERYTNTERGPSGKLEPIQIAALMRRAVYYATPTNCGRFASDFDIAASEGWIKQRGNKAWFTIDSTEAYDD